MLPELSCQGSSTDLKEISSHTLISISNYHGAVPHRQDAIGQAGHLRIMSDENESRPRLPADVEEGL